jgi:hypothetical protein
MGPSTSTGSFSAGPLASVQNSAPSAQIGGNSFANVLNLAKLCPKIIRIR